jgi:hypothetical protein
MKIHPVGAELFMRTDAHDEANNRLSQFCERDYVLQFMYVLKL